MAVDTSRLDKLSPEKRALLLKKLSQKVQEARGAEAIPQRADRSSYPLSFAQERLWVLSQLEPDSPFYNIALALRITGRLDVPALERSLNEIIRRHEVLRASFITDRGNPVQVIAPELQIHIVPEQVGSPDNSPDEIEARALEIANDEARRPFDLSKPPLLRVRLLRLADDHHIALLTMHHIITDGWSTGVLMQELSLLYSAFLRGEQEALLPPLPIQYADFAAWQRERLTGDYLQQELAYWRQALAGIPAMLELLTDRPRPAVQSVRGTVFPFELSPELTAALREFSRSEGVTLYQVLLAAFQVLLHRYSGQDDICVGTPVANRNRPELEGLIGFFVNTLVMRADFSGRPSFREYLRRLRAQALDAHAHQELPFEMLVDELAPERNLSISPIFQVMFSLEQRPAGALHLPGMTITPIETHSGTSKVDLTLFVAEYEDRLRGSFEYNTDLWNAATIARMVGHYRQLLTSIIANPDCTVDELPILTETEQRQLLYEWNDTFTDYPRDKCLHELFEEQVARTPDAIAVRYGDSTVTFAELNRRANQLAHWLQASGVGPEVLVGIFMERSVEMIVAMVAIIKAGGAYLPLDLDYPAERLSFMLEDGKVPVLLTQAALADKLPLSDTVVLRIDADWGQVAAYPETAPVVDVNPGNLAYVIYTSGSTGRPKGVAIPQRAIARLVFNTNYIDLKPSDRIAQASNASFDAATFEIWGALLRGATLVGVSKEVALSARDFVAFLRNERINVLFLTTALFNHIAAEVPDGFKTLGHVLFGGEAVDPRWVRHVLKHGPPERLLHVYGPTESTTFASWYPVREVPEDAKTVPIGRPLSNTTIYVVDRKFQLVPVGVAGELVIGGDGLAVNYLHRPDLTAEKFVPNPFATGCVLHECSRLYRTGDLVRLLPDGSIEFLGRIDHQVKIRGFRIELGEIEVALSNHPALKQVFIMVREDSPGDRRIVAYIVPKDGQKPTISELRAYLKERLPEFMVPAAFVFMDALPLNPNGKVDRKALPAPELTRDEAEANYVAPRTPVEEFLAQKWAETLGVQRVGVHDNFFELGGNSLLAAKLVNRLQEELGTSAHVRALFMAPTIAELAMYLDDYYPEAVARITGIAPEGPAAGETLAERLKAAGAAQVDAEKIARFEAVIPPLKPREHMAPEDMGKNPPAIFVLSPPRSGSTLLRVMLAGNPALFAPPELDLLSFNTLAERRAAFSGKFEFWLEGPLHAIMKLRGCSVQEAEAIMADFEARGWTTKRFYRQLQEWIAETAPGRQRLLVDKTPVYPLDMAILNRMEEDFENARYIHLVRHPFATVYSFLEAKLEQIFFRHEHPFTRRELAELVYTVSHRNILTFLERIPPERKHRVWFEELVAQPERVMREICDFLGIDYHEDMVKPYEGDKMTSGIRPDGQMVGDFKFYLRNRIDPKAAERWKRFKKDDALSQITWQVANQLGYFEETEGAGTEAGKEPTFTLGPITPLPDGAAIPLSFAQQRLWFLDQFEPGSPFYNVPAAVRLTGALHRPALEQSLNEIVRRHEVLRTTFATKDGIPVPQVAAELTIPVPVVDLRGLPPEQREPEAMRLAAEEARRPFNLATGPLVRAKLLQLGDDDHIALVTMHHIVSDGWSVEVFIRELAALYEAFSAGRKSPLPDLPIQYADFAAWQRRWLEQDGGAASPLQQQLQFWQKELAGLPPVLELPTDRPRPAVQTLNGARRPFKLSKELTASVRALARHEGTTLFMTLMAAYQTLLHRYSGQDDIAVGTPIAGRNRPEIANLIGFFVNTLVIRGDLTGNPSFRELLHRVQERAIRAFANQDVPFEMLVEKLQPQRDMSHTPLFQAMFALQDAPLRALKLPGLTIHPLQPDTGTAKFDLILNVVERGDELWGALEYNTDLFDASTAERMIGHFQTLLQGIVADPDRPVDLLPLLTEAERRQLLVDWNATDIPFDTDDTLHARFSQQARRTPDAVAVLAPRRRETRETKETRELKELRELREERELEALTYAELDRRSSQLAHHLVGLGVQPGEIVGLMTERSTDTLVGLFGILKAGAAYLPLDPMYPPERIAFMLEDSRARVVVAQENVLRTAYSGHDTEYRTRNTHYVLLDSDWPEIARQPMSHIPDSRFQIPDSPAYVIYTSGSTGRPKGSVISHRNALNLAAALDRIVTAEAVTTKEHVPLGSGGLSRPETAETVTTKQDRAPLGSGGLSRPLRVSLNAPLAFDASVQQWTMLLYGHTLVVIPDDLRGDAQALLAFIRRHRLDQFDCVPSQLKLLLDAGLLDPDADWTPSIVFPGGEAIDPATWHTIASAPATAFFNMYGPTECTVDSTTALASAHPSRPVIGKPLANVKAYVLDRHLQPVPVGVPGELFLAGAGVGLGYLGRPELTAERFVPNPFVDCGLRIADCGLNDLPTTIRNPKSEIRNSLRLYRTGDLVRWLPDGSLEFLGRTDFQVKVRGFRIELGEIEAALMRHPAIQDVVVDARSLSSGTGDGSKQLVAYLVLRPEHKAQPPNVTELRDFLKRTLPEYMVPAVFMVLDALPLTPNRKVDRKALPAPDQASRLETGHGDKFVAPATEAERILADIWAQVLGVPRVGAHDNFFELGGDSILSIQVIARARQAGLQLTPKQLFQAPTIAQLAAVAGRATSIQAEQGIVTGPVPLTPAQRAFFEQAHPEPNHWNQALLLEVLEPLNPDHLRSALAALLVHHDALRLRFHRTEDGWEQTNEGFTAQAVTTKGDGTPFWAISLADVADGDLPAAIAAQVATAQASLDIERGPLTRMVYMELGPGRPHRLLWVVHHLAVDSVSWRILTEDLLAAYRQLSQGQQVRLPAKTTSFRQWALHLAQYAQSPQLLQQAPFWLDLAGLPPVTLPVDKSEGPNDEASATDLQATLDATETEALLRDVHNAYGTDVNDLLLAALGLTVASWMNTSTPALNQEWRRGNGAGQATFVVPVTMEGHGREEIFDDVDLSRTAGWFTSLYPLYLQLDRTHMAAGHLGQILMAVKEQRRAVPQNGFGFGLLRYLCPDPIVEPLRRLPLPAISFNYLGQFDTTGHQAGLRPAREPVDPERGPTNLRQHLIDLSAAVVDGRLRLTWRYSRNRHTRDTIQRLAAAFLEHLRALIAHCLRPEAVRYTPSDFKEAGLSQEDLDAILAEINE